MDARVVAEEAWQEAGTVLKALRESAVKPGGAS